MGRAGRAGGHDDPVAALRRYADGVHRFEEPATAASIAEAERVLQCSIPEAYRAFLRASDGATLFHEDCRLHGVAPHGDLPPLASRSEGGEALLIFGEAEGPLAFDPSGRVLHLRDEGTRTEGSGFDRWLAALAAAEACLYDLEGEFRDDVFDDESDDGLAAKVQKKRAQAAIAADPEAPAWHEDLARLLLAEGKARQAAAELERAVALDEGAASAWFALGTLRRDAGDPEGAARAWRRAAEAEADPEEAVFAWAQAARAASEAALGEALEYAATVRRLAPAFAAEQRQAAEHLLGEGQVDEALERAGLAEAVAPGDPEVARVHALARARAALRVVGPRP